MTPEQAEALLEYLDAKDKYREMDGNWGYDANWLKEKRDAFLRLCEAEKP